MEDKLINQLFNQIAEELSSPNIIFPISFDLTIRIQILLKNPDLTLDELVGFIHTEPLISSKIFTYANSVTVRGTGREITDLHNAILRIGVESIRTISYAMAIEQLIHSKNMVSLESITNCVWKHSVTVAIISKLLAKRFKLNKDKAFFLGIVHDIGAFYILFKCSTIDELMLEKDKLISLVYQWHEGIGHALLSTLGQSEDILNAIQEHETNINTTTINNFASLLSVSDVISQSINDWVPPEIREKQKRKFDTKLLTEEEIEEIKTQTEEELASLYSIIF